MRLTLACPTQIWFGAGGVTHHYAKVNGTKLRYVRTVIHAGDVLQPAQLPASYEPISTLL
jgi:hypothetical protein